MVHRLQLGMVWDSLLALVCPAECVRCQRLIDSDLGFCSTCLGRLHSNYSRCLKCATPVPAVVPNQDCHRCRANGWRFDRVLTLGPYREDLRDITISMKKPKSHVLRHAIARRMHHVLQESGELEPTQTRRTLVVPVPNHWSHAWSGAANTAGELAHTISRQARLPLSTRLVRRIRKTDKQGMLSWTDRAKNVRGAFQIRDSSGLSECHVILVDDVLTSGATCAEIASQLKRAGCQRVTVLVAARGVGAKETVLQEPLPPVHSPTG